MPQDPIVDRLNKIRRQIQQQCNDDPDDYMDYLRQFQQQQKSRPAQGKPTTRTRKNAM